MIKKGKIKAENFVEITPLGGFGEYGKNMMVIETRNEAIIVDCGVKFPESSMLGVDLVIPDISYLNNRKRKIKGIFITHGHEDHKGGLRYILPQLGNPPVYATKLTQGLISVNLKEANILDTAVLKILKPRKEVTFDELQIEPIHITHSIPDAVMLAIKTPLGTIIHTGDFKFDFTPAAGEQPDVARLAQYGDEGVLLLISDSTNAELPGYTYTEQTVRDTIDRIFDKARGRIIVASFASNISRIQQVIDAAASHGRKVCITGRSIVNNVNIAIELGYLSIPSGILISPAKLNSLPDHKITIISTGTQGETMSVLVRMARGDHKQVQIKKGDTIIISASAIPGNEEGVFSTIDDLMRLGADVAYNKILDVHVSGHARQEEHKLMLSLVRPRYFMPAHGDRHMLVAHAQLARETGIPDQNIFILDNGHTLEITAEGCELNTENTAGYVLVDGLGVGDVGNVVLKDRQVMSENGIFVVVVNIRKGKPEIIGTPEIISRGFVYVKESQELFKEAKKIVIKHVDNILGEHTKPDPARIRGIIKTKLEEFLFEQTERRPMILTVISEVE
jgi:ribonuclease J